MIKKNNYSNISGYQPYQIKHAYGIDKLNSTGKGQTIAIIVAYNNPTIEDDFNTFNKKYNLEPMKIDIEYPEGKPITSDVNWNIETSLDVEWVHALAQEANIMLVVAKSESINDLINAVDYASKKGAQIISMSWGEREFENEANYDKYFKNPNTVYIASSGDNGTEVNWPAISPNVLAVGGTSFTLNPNGNLISFETAWSSSGGGISNSAISFFSFQNI